MLQTVLEANPADETTTARETTLAAYRFMLKARVLDDKFAALYRAGKIHGGVFLGRGQEALSASVGVSLRKTDVFAPLIRDAAGRLAFGETVLDAIRNYLGSSSWVPCAGATAMCIAGKPLEGYFPMISHLGAMISVVNGALFARRMKGISGTVGATCLGDGATSTGAFHEALNQAAVEKLPLVLVLADNQYAYSTPTSRQFVCDDLADKAAGYGVGSHSIDGTDLIACLKQCMPRAICQSKGRGRPAARRCEIAPASAVHTASTDDSNYTLIRKFEKFPARPRLPESGRGIFATAKVVGRCDLCDVAQ